MRLYCQQGFSSRIVQALRIRLERTLRMAAEEGHCHGGSSRIHSRGRGAEADAANLGSETSTVLDSTGAGMGDVAGLRQVLKWVNFGRSVGSDRRSVHGAFFYMVAELYGATHTILR